VHRQNNSSVVEDLLVTLEVALGGKALAATFVFASEGFLSRMATHVYAQGMFTSKSFSTVIALERFFLRVDHDMPF